MRQILIEKETFSTKMDKLKIVLDDRLLEQNLTGYEAKNVSNDKDFTKMFFPSIEPSVPPTPSPTPRTIISCPTPTHEDIISNDADALSSMDDLNSLTKHVSVFKYEIVTPIQNVDLDIALESMEERILLDISKNVLACEGIQNSINRRLTEKFENIVLVESEPQDVIDEFEGKNCPIQFFQFLNSMLLNIFCTSILVECTADTGITAEASVRCTPILGAMTFYSNCGKCSYPEDEILAFIEEAMDGGVFVDNEMVKQVNFVTIEKLRAKQVAMGSSFGILLFVGILVTAFMLKGRYKFRRSRTFVSLGDDIVEDDERSYISRDEWISHQDSRTMNLRQMISVNEDEEGINMSYFPNLPS